MHVLLTARLSKNSSRKDLLDSHFMNPEVTLKTFQKETNL